MSNNIITKIKQTIRTNIRGLDKSLWENFSSEIEQLFNKEPFYKDEAKIIYRIDSNNEEFIAFVVAIDRRDTICASLARYKMIDGYWNHMGVLAFKGWFGKLEFAKLSSTNDKDEFLHVIHEKYKSIKEKKYYG